MSDEKRRIAEGYQPKKKKGWQPQAPKGDSEKPNPKGGSQQNKGEADIPDNPPKEE